MPSDDPTLSTVLSEDLETEKRQNLIESIEGDLQHLTGSDDVRLMTYITDESMNFSDVKAFEDMLQSVDEPEDLFLLINSTGGDPETALRIIQMCRERSGEFRTIIPDMAKSAATQVCLGSKEIYMGYNSEIGPIDPQIQFRNEWTAAYTLQQGLEYIEERARTHPDVPTQIYAAIAQHYDPAKLQEAKKAIQYIRDSAIEIAGYMFDDDEEAQDCVMQLLEEIPHSKAITIEEAQEMGISVFDMRDEDHLWSCVWELYIRSDIAMGREGVSKMWETKEHLIGYQGSSSNNSDVAGYLD